MSTIFWMIWRRLYGEGTFKKYVGRGLQTVIAVAALSAQMCDKWVWPTAGLAVAVAVWVIIQYWSRAVGEIIDAGLNNLQTAESYNRWFRVPLDWVYDRLGKEKYVGFYDFWYSAVRYGIGVLPLLYYSWLAVLLIPFQYFIYLGCHKFYAKFPKAYGWPLTINDPKNLAEVIHGALFGLIVGLM